MTDTPSRASAIADPMERLIAEALDSANVDYVCEPENPSGLDFRLANGVEIEVKRFHSDRITAQMARAPNVIAVQGEAAVAFLAGLIARQARLEEIIAEAYQVVGSLTAEAGLFETDDVERALDILCLDEEKQHASMLPFAPQL